MDRGQDEPSVLLQMAVKRGLLSLADADLARDRLREVLPERRTGQWLVDQGLLTVEQLVYLRAGFRTVPRTPTDQIEVEPSPLPRSRGMADAPEIPGYGARGRYPRALCSLRRCSRAPTAPPTLSRR